MRWWSSCLVCQPGRESESQTREETRKERAQRCGRAGPWGSCPLSPAPSAIFSKESSRGQSSWALGPVAHSPHKMPRARHLGRDPAESGEGGQGRREGCSTAANRLLPPRDGGAHASPGSAPTHTLKLGPDPSK